MTQFEMFALEIIGKVETDQNGFYTGKTLALMQAVNEIILSDNEEIRKATWMIQKEMILEKFYKIFPYMRKETKA